MAAATPLTPSVSWAQRPSIIFLTINVSDVTEPEIKVEKGSLHFKGIGGADKKAFELNMNFMKEVSPEATKYQVKPRCIEFALEKAEDGPYWDRLLEDKTKQHWLKVDFGKWKDEDDSDNEGAGGAGGAGGGDLEEMMKNMGGLGGGGMGGMGGMGGAGGMDMASMMAGMGGDKPNMDDLEDSDDEDLPDLE